MSARTKLPCQACCNRSWPSCESRAPSNRRGPAPTSLAFLGALPLSAAGVRAAEVGGPVSTAQGGEQMRRVGVGGDLGRSGTCGLRFKVASAHSMVDTSCALVLSMTPAAASSKPESSTPSATCPGYESRRESAAESQLSLTHLVASACWQRGTRLHASTQSNTHTHTHTHTHAWPCWHTCQHPQRNPDK